MSGDRAPAHGDVEIKAVLDNCRLDYVYEPDWTRLVDRAVRLLASAKTVAWFQPEDHASGGLPPLVLCDPAARFVRDNVNGFLLGRPLDHPLPLLLTGAEAASLVSVLPSPSALERCLRRPDAPGWVSVLADAEGHCLGRTFDPAAAARLHSLCAAWYAHTGRPALVAVDFAVDRERVVSSTRTAVQAYFSSAIDALIAGHFLLMKDYWLMRSPLK